MKKLGEAQSCGQSFFGLHLHGFCHGGKYNVPESIIYIFKISLYTSTLHLKYSVGKADLSCFRFPHSITLTPTPAGRGRCFGEEIEMRKYEFIHFVLAAHSLWPSALKHFVCELQLLDQSQKAFFNVVFSLGPSMAVRIVLALILSTSFVIQKNAKSTLRTSGHSSASSVTPTLSTRMPNTTGCHMNIPTVSRCHLLPAVWMAA